MIDDTTVIIPLGKSFHRHVLEEHLKDVSRAYLSGKLTVEDLYEKIKQSKTYVRRSENDRENIEANRRRPSKALRQVSGQVTELS